MPMKPLSFCYKTLCLYYLGISVIYITKIFIIIIIISYYMNLPSRLTFIKQEINKGKKTKNNEQNFHFHFPFCFEVRTVKETETSLAVICFKQSLLLLKITTISKTNGVCLLCLQRTNKYSWFSLILSDFVWSDVTWCMVVCCTQNLPR